MFAHWSTAEDDDEIADFMNSVPKVVFSSTLDAAEWNNTTQIRGDLEAEVRRLKALPGKDILVFGSAEICDSLLRAELVDEYRLGLAPVVLGAGNPLFKPAARHLPMELLQVRPLNTGAVILYYRPLPRPEAEPR
jgi:dihydrofolate reductase